MSPGTYKLKDAKKLLREGQYQINGNALQTALDDFGWQEPDIKAAFRKLNGDLIINGGHFYRTKPSNTIPGLMLDIYKAEDLNGERVYAHFYIEENWLVINSFHRLDRDEV